MAGVLLESLVQRLFSPLPAQVSVPGAEEELPHLGAGSLLISPCSAALCQVPVPGSEEGPPDAYEAVGPADGGAEPRAAATRLGRLVPQGARGEGQDLRYAQTRTHTYIHTHTH